MCAWRGGEREKERERAPLLPLCLLLGSFVHILDGVAHFVQIIWVELDNSLCSVDSLVWIIVCKLRRNFFAAWLDVVFLLMHFYGLGQISDSMRCITAVLFVALLIRVLEIVKVALFLVF